MINGEVGAAGAGRWKIVEWPAVSEVHNDMVVEVWLDFEEEAVLWDGNDYLRNDFIFVTKLRT